MGDTNSAIVGYRWFQICDDGHLAGAQNVTWPPGEALHAHHVPAPFFNDRAETTTPLMPAVWSALRVWERLGTAVATIALIVVLAVTVGIGAALVAAAGIGAVLWQVCWRHRALNHSILRVMGVVIALSAFALAVTTVWLVVLAGLSASANRWANTERGLGGAILCAGLAVAYTALVAMYVGPLWRPSKHQCPAPPRRLIARWVPECGIHAYRSLESATKGASQEWLLSRPVIVARVSLWGRVFAYSDGFRGEWGRIETLFDDGTGHVEVPAARYGTQVETLPTGLSVVAPGRLPRQVAAMMTTGAAILAWAERRRKDR